MSSKATEIAKNLPALEHPDGSPIRALVVDDEEMLKELVSMGLKMIGWDVQSAGAGPSALAIARDWRPDVLVLDIMMPGTDRLSICSQLRQENSNLPIIIVSAKDSPFDRVTGLTLGSDDYLIKPFLPQELVARVRALLRRSQNTYPPSDVPCELTFGALTLSPGLHTAILNNQPLTLTPTEFDFLSYMIAHQERAVSRDELLQTLWKMDWQSDTRATDDLVKRLRRKLRTQQSNIRIESVWGFGFRLALEDELS